MDLKAEASRYHLNYLWWLLEPLLYVGVFYIVFKVFLASPQEQFLLFLMCGKIPFLWFSKAVNGASGSIIANKGLIAQTSIAKFVFPHAVVLENTYRQWLTFLLLFALAASYGHMPSMLWLCILPIFVTQMIITQAAGLLGALLVSFYEDFRPIIQLGTTFLMFGSGIFWSIEDIGSPQLQELIMNVNPLAFIFDAYRTVLMDNQTVDWAHLTSIAAFGIATLGLLHLAYQALDQHIARQVI